MKINGYIDSLRPKPGSPPAVQRPAPDVSEAVAARPVRSDTVQLSAEARRLSAEQRDTLDPERVAELRQEVLNGAYMTLDRVDQVARRILSRGDL